MPKIRKITIIFIFFFLFLSLFILIRPVWAAVHDRNSWSETISDTNSNYTLEDNNQQVLFNNMHSLLDATSGNKKLKDSSGKKVKGALPALGNSIAIMITEPPASTGEYLADLGSSLGISTKQAYVQGTGWKALSPILDVWKTFRNIAYLGFVIIFVVIGFMIMFRAKLDAQTVITVQSALPKIVITLLVITFSYAIAGLMIDLIYIAIYLAVGVFKFSDLIVDSGKVIDRLLERNLFDIILGAGVFHAGAGAAVDDMILTVLGDNLWGQITKIAGGDVLFNLIVAVGLLFVVFKVFVSLLLSYVGIVIQVIFAPITLLFNALPNSNSLGNWIKGLLSNILPFPAVAIMLLLAAVFMGVEPQYGGSCSDDTNPWCVEEGVGYLPAANDPNQDAWMPPFIAVGGPGPISALIGLGIVVMTPTVVSKIKKMLQVEPSGFGGAIASGLLGPISGATQLGMTALSLGSTITTLKGPRSQRPGVKDDISAALKAEPPPSAGGTEQS